MFVMIFTIHVIYANCNSLCDEHTITLVKTRSSEMSIVSEIEAAQSDVAINHFSKRLALETDCSDVYSAIASDEQDFVLLHVIGRSEVDFKRKHIPTAVFMPHRQITKDSIAAYPEDTLFVVYCAGPHCNGADKAALKLAMLGRSVKLMLGGLVGWEQEGFALVHQ